MATRNFVPRADGEGGIGTSVKQWAGGFFKKLAVGAITTAVTVLTPSADANNQQPATTNWVRTQFKSILEGVLSAAGLKYNLDKNGYICFGSLFGGLILQWVYGYTQTVSWPLSFSKCYIALPVSTGDINDENTAFKEYGMRGSILYTDSYLKSWFVRSADGSLQYGVRVGYIGIGI